jgi:hypothetical protein
VGITSILHVEFIVIMAALVKHLRDLFFSSFLFSRLYNPTVHLPAGSVCLGWTNSLHYIVSDFPMM